LSFQRKSRTKEAVFGTITICCRILLGNSPELQSQDYPTAASSIYPSSSSPDSWRDGYTARRNTTPNAETPDGQCILSLDRNQIS